MYKTMKIINDEEQSMHVDLVHAHRSAIVS